MATSTEPRVACRKCGREILACYACEGRECPDPICARDLILLTGESLPQPHTHGG